MHYILIFIRTHYSTFNFYLTIILFHFTSCTYRIKPINEMKTVFIKTLQLFILITKVFGFINVSYTLKTGLLIRSTNTMYFYIEVLRVCVLVVFTYIVNNLGPFYVRKLNIIRFWLLVVIAKITEKWTIKYV